MTTIQSRKIHSAARLLLTALIAASLGQAMAQDAPRQTATDADEMKPAAELQMRGRIDIPVDPGKLTSQAKACPHPLNLVLTAQSGPAVQAAQDFASGWNVAGSAFNGTQPNRHFGHTFQFKVPEGKCCEANDARLVVTYRALSNGQSHQTSDAGNDGGGPVRNGVAHNYMQPGGYRYIWPATGVTAGTTTSVNYAIPASWIASGRVSFFAQDDTAVLKAVLVVSACCVTQTQPAK